MNVAFCLGLSRVSINAVYRYEGFPSLGISQSMPVVSPRCDSRPTTLNHRATPPTPSSFTPTIQLVSSVCARARPHTHIHSQLYTKIVRIKAPVLDFRISSSNTRRFRTLFSVTEAHPFVWISTCTVDNHISSPHTALCKFPFVKHVRALNTSEHLFLGKSSSCVMPRH